MTGRDIRDQGASMGGLSLSEGTRHGGEPSVPPHRQSGLPGLPAPGLLKNAKKAAWDDQFNRALQEIAWTTVSGYPYSGVKAAQPGAEKKDEKKEEKKHDKAEKFPEPPKSFDVQRDGIEHGKLEAVEYWHCHARNSVTYHG